jgi:outer membrane lipoprotein-sorting protein
MNVPRQWVTSLSMLTVAILPGAVPARPANASRMSSMAASELGRTSLPQEVAELPTVAMIRVTQGFDLFSEIAAAVSIPPPARSGPKPGQDAAKSSNTADSEAELRQVIAQMDRTAARFQTTQAKFVWTQYTAVVNDSDVQKGTVYFRRVHKQVQMAADITEPIPKQVLFTDSKVQLYLPNTNQLTQYDTGKNQAVVESFLVLGFGGSGQDMLNSFSVSYLGGETVDGIAAAKLDLVPKSEKARNAFGHIWLWIDLANGISIEQKLFAPDGDYRLASYSDIHLNEKIPDSAFKLKTGLKSSISSPRS